MSYDHRDKAGNEGDLAKHVVLVAALDTRLATLTGEGSDGTFRYADLFAGFAFCDLPAQGPWRRGIAELAARWTARHVGEASSAPAGGTDTVGTGSDNPHVRLYATSFAGRRPYPGSASIAAELARRRGLAFRPALYDVAPEPVADLRAAFDGEGCAVLARPADREDAAVRDAHFVFIDPPGVDRTTMPAWSQLSGFVTERPAGQDVLIWLPILSGVADVADRTLAAAGLSMADVTWGEGEGLTGCRLAWTLHDPGDHAVRAAVQALATEMDWAVQPAG
jgi:23S rRNA A2030 N6-methylase RlmJ